MYTRLFSSMSRVKFVENIHFFHEKVQSWSLIYHLEPEISLISTPDTSKSRFSRARSSSVGGAGQAVELMSGTN